MQFKSNFKQRNKTIQGLRSFKDTLPTKVKRIIKKKGLIFSQTLDNWRFIVGDELFEVCYPKSFKSSNKLNSSILNIMIKRGHEVDIEYSKNQIIEKMNKYFGYNVIEKIKLITFEGDQEKFRKKIKKGVTKSQYLEKISNIKNDKIKNSLLELSKYFKKKMKNIILRFLLLMVICFPVNSETSIKPIIEGNVDAKIKLIVYESLTCSHCAKFHKEIYPQLKEQYIDTGLVTIEFKSFPLDIIALNASKIAHCRNDGKSEILHFLFKNQNDWVKGDTVEELNTNLKKVLNKQKFSLNFDKCLENKLVEDFVLEDRIEAVKKYKINATPTIIINEEKFDKPLNYKNLKKILEKLI